jgi:putative ATP-binding cassette transporter
VLDAVKVETRHGCVETRPARLEVAPGERVLVLGKPGSGRTSFFLALAGLWNAGSGRIGVPAADGVAYLTQRPYLPSGPLRTVLNANDSTRGDAELQAALKRVGLDTLAGGLDHSARWDRELGIGEQERLGYARLLLARPKWLICDEGLDPVDEANRETILSIMQDELAGSAMINISHRREPAGFYGKEVTLVTSPSASPPPAPPPARKRRLRPARASE